MDFARQRGMNSVGEKTPVTAVIKGQLVFFFPEFANFWVLFFLIFCFSLLILNFFLSSSSGFPVNFLIPAFVLFSVFTPPEL